MQSKNRFIRFLIGQAPLLVAVIGLCMALGLLLDRMDRTRMEMQVSTRVASLTAGLHQSVQVHLYRKALALGGLVTAAEMLPDMVPDEFERLAMRIVKSAPDISTVILAPNLRIQNIYPTSVDGSVIGQDYRAAIEKANDLEAVKSSQMAVLSAPFFDENGHRSVALRERIETPDGLFWGLASIVINIDALFAPLLHDIHATNDYRVAFVLNEDMVLGDRNILTEGARLETIQIQDLQITVAIMPSDGWPTLPLLTPTRIGVVIAMLLILSSGYANYCRNFQRRVAVERLEKGIDALSSGFVIFDENDRLVQWNETYEKLFHAGSVLTKGMAFADLMRLDVKHGIYRVPSGQEDMWLNRVMSGHRDAQDAAEVELADGRWIKMLSRRTHEGDLVGVRFDITDLKNAQLMAERTSKAKSEFISVVSHELRTPLTTILGFGRLLKARPVLSGNSAQDAFAKDAIDRIVLSGEHLLKLVNEMLDYVNLTSSLPGNKRAAFDLSEVIAKTAEDMRPAATAKGIRLEADPCPITVSADSMRVSQIMENLLSNAVKFTAPGGTVRISAVTGPQCAKITVSDTGDGIPQDELNKIFEEFSQIHPSGTRRQGGTGLGLAITKRLVMLQGGDISVQSTLGEGSAFTFSLPLDQQVDHQAVA